MKFSSFKRIIAEDFDKAYQALITKLAYPINSLMEQVSQAMDKNVTFGDNLYVQIKDLEVSVDASGNIGSLSFKSDLKSKSQGIFLLRCENASNPTLLPSSAPFVFFSENAGIITISKITGLDPNTRYKVRLVSVG